MRVLLQIGQYMLEKPVAAADLPPIFIGAVIG